MGSFFSKLVDAIQSAAPAVQQIGENIVSAAGSPLQQESLQANRELALRKQQLGMQQQLQQATLRSSDLENQLRQRELANYQTPAERQAAALDTLSKQLQLQRTYGEPQDLVGAVDGQPGQQAHFQRTFNPKTGEYDISPAMVSRQTVVSSPDNPKVPFDPNQTVTRIDRRQLLASPKSAGAALIEPDQSSITGYSHVWRDAQGAEIGRAANALPPSGFVPKTTTGSRTTVIQTDQGPQTVTLPSSSTTAPARPGTTQQRQSGGGGGSATTRPIVNSQGNQVQPQVTAATRSMKEAAPHVLDFINRIEPLVQQNVGNMGPLSVRWSDFWTGKAGAPDPAYNALRVDDGLLSTLLMRMHTGSRGAVQMQAHFQDLLGLAHQSPENYLSALGEIRKYANDLMGNSDTPAPAGNTVTLQDFLNEKK